MGRYPYNYPEPLPEGFKVCFNTILSYLRQYAIDSVHNHMIESMYKIDACNEVLTACVRQMPNEHRDRYTDWLNGVRADMAESVCIGSNAER